MLGYCHNWLPILNYKKHGHFSKYLLLCSKELHDLWLHNCHFEANYPFNVFSLSLSQKVQIVNSRLTERRLRKRVLGIEKNINHPIKRQCWLRWGICLGGIWACLCHQMSWYYFMAVLLPSIKQKKVLHKVGRDIWEPVPFTFLQFHFNASGHMDYFNDTLMVLFPFWSLTA